MLAPRAIAPDGSPVAGFRFDGARVAYDGAEPVEAGVRIELELPAAGDPHWLVPGVFYGENRPERCTRIYPRFTPGRVDVERMESDRWSFRADRCATPAVFANGRGLLTSEVSPLGQAGVGFAWRDGRPVVWLDFPFREEPLRYDGSETPAAPDVRMYRWQPGESVELDVREGTPPTCDPETPFADPGWVSVEEAAALAAHGLYRWALQAGSAAPDRDAVIRHRRGAGSHARLLGQWRPVRPRPAPGTRSASATTSTGRPRRRPRPRRREPHPGGTFWAQWTVDRGRTWGRHPDHSRPTRARSPTRPCSSTGGLSAGPRWQHAVRSNLDVVRRTQRDDVRLPAAHHVETGDAVSWEGTAGMAWIPALVLRRATSMKPWPRGVLQALRHLVRRARGRRPGPDLRGRLRGGDGVRRARGLGDGEARGGLDADVPLHLRRRLPARLDARATRLPDAGRRPGLARKPAPARVRADLPPEMVRLARADRRAPGTSRRRARTPSPAFASSSLDPTVTSAR